MKNQILNQRTSNYIYFWYEKELRIPTKHKESNEIA